MTDIHLANLSLESVGIIIVFTIYLLTLSFLGGLLSVLGSKLAQRLLN